MDIRHPNILLDEIRQNISLASSTEEKIKVIESAINDEKYKSLFEQSIPKSIQEMYIDLVKKQQEEAINFSKYVFVNILGDDARESKIGTLKQSLYAKIRDQITVNIIDDILNTNPPAQSSCIEKWAHMLSVSIEQGDYFTATAIIDALGSEKVEPLTKNNASLNSSTANIIDNAKKWNYSKGIRSYAAMLESANRRKGIIPFYGGFQNKLTLENDKIAEKYREKTKDILTYLKSVIEEDNNKLTQHLSDDEKRKLNQINDEIKNLTSDFKISKLSDGQRRKITELIDKRKKVVSELARSHGIQLTESESSSKLDNAIKAITDLSRQIDKIQSEILVMQEKQKKATPLTPAQNQIIKQATTNILYEKFKLVTSKIGDDKELNSSLDANIASIIQVIKENNINPNVIREAILKALNDKIKDKANFITDREKLDNAINDANVAIDAIISKLESNEISGIQKITKDDVTNAFKKGFEEKITESRGETKQTIINAYNKIFNMEYSPPQQKAHIPTSNNNKQTISFTNRDNLHNAAYIADISESLGNLTGEIKNIKRKKEKNTRINQENALEIIRNMRQIVDTQSLSVDMLKNLQTQVKEFDKIKGKQPGLKQLIKNLNEKLLEEINALEIKNNAPTKTPKPDQNPPTPPKPSSINRPATSQISPQNRSTTGDIKATKPEDKPKQLTDDDAIKNLITDATAYINNNDQNARGDAINAFNALFDPNKHTISDSKRKKLLENINDTSKPALKKFIDELFAQKNKSDNLKIRLNYLKEYYDPNSEKLATSKPISTPTHNQTKQTSTNANIANQVMRIETTLRECLKLDKEIHANYTKQRDADENHDKEAASALTKDIQRLMSIHEKLFKRDVAKIDETALRELHAEINQIHQKIKDQHAKVTSSASKKPDTKPEVQPQLKSAMKSAASAAKDQGSKKSVRFSDPLTSSERPADASKDSVASDSTSLSQSDKSPGSLTDTVTTDTEAKPINNTDEPEADDMVQGFVFEEATAPDEVDDIESEVKPPPLPRTMNVEKRKNTSAININALASPLDNEKIQPQIAQQMPAQSKQPTPAAPSSMSAPASAADTAIPSQADKIKAAKEQLRKDLMQKLGMYDSPKTVNGKDIRDLLSPEAYNILMEGTKESTQARKDFINALVEVLYDETTDFKGQKTNPVNDAVSRIRLGGTYKYNGKNLQELYLAALNEEKNTVAFREAVFMQAIEHRPGATWTKRLVQWVAGPSASGKSVTKKKVLEEAAKKMATSDKKDGNYILSIDGGIERDMSQMRRLLLDASIKKGYPGVSDLDKDAKIGTKKIIQKAALANRGDKPLLHLLIPNTFTNPNTIKKLIKFAKDPNVDHFFAEIVGEEKDAFQNAVRINGERRAYKQDYGKPNQAEDRSISAETPPEVESKAYKGKHFTNGQVASETAAEIFAAAHPDNYIRVASDWIYVRKNGDQWVIASTADKDDNPDRPMVGLTKRQFEHWKKKSPDSRPDLQEWLNPKIHIIEDDKVIRLATQEEIDQKKHVTKTLKEVEDITKQNSSTITVAENVKQRIKEIKDDLYGENYSRLATKTASSHTNDSGVSVRVTPQKASPDDKTLVKKTIALREAIKFQAQPTTAGKFKQGGQSLSDLGRSFVTRKRSPAEPDKSTVRRINELEQRITRASTGDEIASCEKEYDAIITKEQQSPTPQKYALKLGELSEQLSKRKRALSSGIESAPKEPPSPSDSKPSTEPKKGPTESTRPRAAAVPPPVVDPDQTKADAAKIAAASQPLIKKEYLKLRSQLLSDLAYLTQKNLHDKTQADQIMDDIEKLNGKLDASDAISNDELTKIQEAAKDVSQKANAAKQHAEVNLDKYNDIKPAALQQLDQVAALSEPLPAELSEKLELLDAKIAHIDKLKDDGKIIPDSDIAELTELADAIQSDIKKQMPPAQPSGAAVKSSEEEAKPAAAPEPAARAPDQPIITPPQDLAAGIKADVDKQKSTKATEATTKSIDQLIAQSASSQKLSPQASNQFSSLFEEEGSNDEVSKKKYKLKDGAEDHLREKLKDEKTKNAFSKMLQELDGLYASDEPDISNIAKKVALMREKFPQLQPAAAASAASAAKPPEPAEAERAEAEKLAEESDRVAREAGAPDKRPEEAVEAAEDDEEDAHHAVAKEAAAKLAKMDQPAQAKPKRSLLSTLSFGLLGGEPKPTSSTASTEPKKTDAQRKPSDSTAAAADAPPSSRSSASVSRSGGRLSASSSEPPEPLIEIKKDSSITFEPKSDKTATQKAQDLWDTHVTGKRKPVCIVSDDPEVVAALNERKTKEAKDDVHVVDTSKEKSNAQSVDPKMQEVARHMAQGADVVAVIDKDSPASRTLQEMHDMPVRTWRSAPLRDTYIQSQGVQARVDDASRRATSTAERAEATEKRAAEARRQSAEAARREANTDMKRREIEEQQQRQQQARRAAAAPPTSSSGTPAPTEPAAAQPPQPSGAGAAGQQQQQPPAGTGAAGQQQQQPPAGTGAAGQQQQQPPSAGTGAAGQQQQQPPSAGTGAAGQQQQQPPSGASAAGQPNSWANIPYYSDRSHIVPANYNMQDFINSRQLLDRGQLSRPAPNQGTNDSLKDNKRINQTVIGQAPPQNIVVSEQKFENDKCVSNIYYNKNNLENLTKEDYMKWAAVEIKNFYAIPANQGKTLKIENGSPDDLVKAMATYCKHNNISYKIATDKAELNSYNPNTNEYMSKAETETINQQIDAKQQNRERQPRQAPEGTRPAEAHTSSRRGPSGGG